jgi:hypothetical protein
VDKDLDAALLRFQEDIDLQLQQKLTKLEGTPQSMASEHADQPSSGSLPEPSGGNNTGAHHSSQLSTQSGGRAV